MVFLSAPTVGEKYTVICLKYKDGSPWIPVRGDKHADEGKFFSSTEPHYHVDWRFAGNAVFEYLELKLNFDDLNDAPLIVLPASLPLHEHELKSLSKLCLREELPYPSTRRERVWDVPYGRHKKIKFREELYNIYKGQELINNTCPHRAYNMSDITPNCKGHKVCPLHGLTFGKNSTVIRHFDTPHR